MVADCAEAITNGCNAVFGEHVTRVHCWYHVITNVRKKLATLKVPSQQAELEADISTLQLAKSQDEFDAAKTLFLKKWNSDVLVLEFLEYFKSEYLSKNNSWFEGRASGAPSTNNCLEATNNVIKNKGTLRNRLPLGQFIETAKAILSMITKARNSESVNAIHFATIPTITLALQTAAYNWTRAKPNIKIRTINGQKLYFVQPTVQPKQKKMT